MHLQSLGGTLRIRRVARACCKTVASIFPNFSRISPVVLPFVVIKLVQLQKIGEKIFSLTLLLSVKALQLAVVVRLLFVGCFGCLYFYFVHIITLLCCLPG